MLEASSHLASQGQTTGLIPPGSTTFHLLLAVHIAAAPTCVATGAAATLSPKRPARPPRRAAPPRRPGWPPAAGRKTPPCWYLAPCRLPPPPSAGPPGVEDGNGGA